MPNDSRPKTYLADAVYVSLRRALVSGDFDPGEPLTEAALCRRFEVSRTPVREALAKLERDQLVRVVPKKGAFVPTLSHAEIRELYHRRPRAWRRSPHRAADDQPHPIDVVGAPNGPHTPTLGMRGRRRS